jgi:hypothetical protein
LALDSRGTGTLYAGFNDAGGVWQFRRATGEFHTLTPCRILDTRSSGGPALAAGSTRRVVITGKCDIPADAGTVSMNVTVTAPSGEGHLRLFPGGTPLPPNSIINFSPGQTRANSAISLLGAAGDIAIYVGQLTGSVQLIIDVNGYFR